MSASVARGKRLLARDCGAYWNPGGLKPLPSLYTGSRLRLVRQRVYGIALVLHPPGSAVRVVSTGHLLCPA
eukprot:1036571-Rhodomonas_salina.4